MPKEINPIATREREGGEVCVKCELGSVKLKKSSSCVQRKKEKWNKCDDENLLMGDAEAEGAVSST